MSPGEQHASLGTPFTLQRRGVLAEPDPDCRQEAWGILNPGAARGRDGQLYLFPRVVAEGSYSRIAVAHLLFDADGRPHHLERRGYALEPTEPYERNPKSGGGCEDARVSYLAPLNVYVMAYTASTLLGPRIALAISPDLFQWQRLGLARFGPACPIAISSSGNTDGCFFPEPVLDVHGRPSLALIHRPTYRVAQADGTILQIVPPGISERRSCLWISYISLERARADPTALTQIEETHPLAGPEQPWEHLQMGGGTPPLLTRHGWLVLSYGVSGHLVEGAHRQERLRYAIGALVLDPEDPRQIRYRSTRPLLEPEHSAEQEGMMPHVIVPTGIDPRSEPDDPEGCDVYYGMANTRIGVARLHIPAVLAGTR
jgi:predicted GH43/DUF377 family glycosyl hydrolase